MRVDGTAVYLASEAGGMPRALLNNLRFNRVLHERNILLTFVRPETPFCPPEERVEVQNLRPGPVPHYCALRLHGDAQRRRGIARGGGQGRRLRARADGVCRRARESGVRVGSGMPQWRKRLFALMGRNSQLAAIHFGVPRHRMLEVSSQVKL